jgi:hypothetical protein
MIRASLRLVSSIVFATLYEIFSRPCVAKTPEDPAPPDTNVIGAGCPVDSWLPLRVGTLPALVLRYEPESPVSNNQP